MKTAVTNLRRHAREPQHRDATLLMANTGLAAVAGLAFWLVLTRVLDLPAAEIGVGYAVVAVGTTIGLLAKGGLDTALVRSLPSVGPHVARRLLFLGIAIAGVTALLVAAALTLAGQTGHALTSLSGPAWVASAGIGLLLSAAWLLDAYFLCAGQVRVNLLRTLAASAVRIALPFVAFTAIGPGPVAWAWAAGLVASLVVSAPFLRRALAQNPAHAAATTTATATVATADFAAANVDPYAANPVRPFLANANRNLAGSAAEFLPGLLLAPVVLALEGGAAAAYFGMAWTVASLLFLAASAVGRSALAAMARPGASLSGAVRRGAAQSAVVVGGGALAGIVLAPVALGVFGADYAREAGLAFAILCASAFVVAPGSLYLAVLRMRERTATLVLVPVTTMALLLTLVPVLEPRWGLAGVAGAWALANLPFGAWSLFRLAHDAREVNPDAQPHGGRAHVE